MSLSISHNPFWKTLLISVSYRLQPFQVNRRRTRVNRGIPSRAASLLEESFRLKIAACFPVYRDGALILSNEGWRLVHAVYDTHRHWSVLLDVIAIQRWKFRILKRVNNFKPFDWSFQCANHAAV